MSARIYVDALRNHVRWHQEEEAGNPHVCSRAEREANHEIVLSALWGLQRMGLDAWRFLQDAIALAADDDEVLRYIGAGDLETLIMWHGDDLIAEIESKAPNNRALRVALSDVWGWGPVQDRIVTLLETYGPPPSKPLRG